MTIDEAKAIMKSAFKECIEHDTELNVVDANVDILNALEELKWWREQDFIRREDVIGGCYCMDNYDRDCSRGKHCENCTCNVIDSSRIKEIPKAEYTGVSYDR